MKKTNKLIAFLIIFAICSSIFSVGVYAKNIKPKPQKIIFKEFRIKYTGSQAPESDIARQFRR